jgi:hypothetical protein
MDALNESDAHYRIRLASRYIVTGELSGGNQIRSVKIGNKLDLSLDCPRTWIIPHDVIENFKNASIELTGSVVDHQPARTLGEVYDVLKPDRIVSEGLKPWPHSKNDNPLILHALLTKDSIPVRSVIKNCYPSELHLWVTKDRDSVKECINTLVSEVYKYKMRVRIHDELVCHEPEQASKRLCEVVKSLNSVENQLFDISDASYFHQTLITGLAKRMGFKIICRDSADQAFHQYWYDRHIQYYCELISPKSIPRRSDRNIPSTLEKEPI